MQILAIVMHIRKSVTNYDFFLWIDPLALGIIIIISSKIAVRLGQRTSFLVKPWSTFISWAVCLVIASSVRTLNYFAGRRCGDLLLARPGWHDVTETGEDITPEMIFILGRRLRFTEQSNIQHCGKAEVLHCVGRKKFISSSHFFIPPFLLFSLSFLSFFLFFFLSSPRSHDISQELR